MTTEQTSNNCSLSTLLPMSCRGRAEDFARRLHSKLSSLGSHQDDTITVVDENSWLATNRDEHGGGGGGGSSSSNNINTTLNQQPSKKHSNAAASIYFEYDDLNDVSPESPEEEEETIGEDQPDYQEIINKDSNIDEEYNNCSLGIKKLMNGIKSSASVESDSSDGPFFDTQIEFQDDEESSSKLNGITNGTGTNSLQDIFTTSSECTLPVTLTQSKESLSSSDTSTSSELPQDNPETYTSCLSIKNDLIIECPKVLIQESSFHDEDAEEERIPRVRRCSSLKTGKTPPGTPSRKKIVRFADVLGLDLADIRTFLDEIPKVPTSAYDDLRDVDLLSESSEPNLLLLNHGIKFDKILVPLFQQPGGSANFMERVREQNVCLENAMVGDPLALAVTGTVRVRNLDFNKSVHIRYTLDSWQTFADLQACYVENSCDGFSDTFKFLMYAHSLGIGQKLQFAIRFQCKGVQYWDNNKGINYCFECLPTTNPSSSAPSYPSAIAAGVGDDSWAASFYY